MSQQEKKSGGVLLIVFIILLFLFIFIPALQFGVLHIFNAGGTHEMVIPHIAPIFRGPFVMIIPVIVMTLLWLLISIWVYNDAERRGMSGILWALLVFFGNIIALIIYLIVRSGSASQVSATLSGTYQCPNCNASIQKDFSICPYCGTNLKSTCPKCKKEVETSWEYCPSCGSRI